MSTAGTGFDSGVWKRLIGHPWSLGVIGILAVLLLWQLIAGSGLVGGLEAGGVTVTSAVGPLPTRGVKPVALVCEAASPPAITASVLVPARLATREGPPPRGLIRGSKRLELDAFDTTMANGLSLSEAQRKI
jgi:hypothetical protein